MNIFDGIKGFNWGEIVYNTHSTYGPRHLSFYQLVLVHSGFADIRSRGQVFRIKAGQMGFLTPGVEEFFQFSDLEPTHHSWIHVELEADHDVWKALREKRGTVVSISSLSRFLMQELLQLGAPKSLLRQQMGVALAEAIFTDFFANAGFDFEPSTPGHPAVQRAMGFMQQHFRRNCDLGTIAAAAGLSAQHLIRLFRKESGRTPAEYLWRIRESEGLRLLRHTGLTIAEIAGLCGFQNPFHFTRRMKQRFGHPPRALRLQFWGRGPLSE